MGRLIVRGLGVVYRPAMVTFPVDDVEPAARMLAARPLGDLCPDAIVVGGDPAVPILPPDRVQPLLGAVSRVFAEHRSCRRELLDRTLIWNQRHLLHVLREYETFYNEHRPHQGIANARPLAPLPEPITGPHLNIHQCDRLGGILHEYEHAA